MGDALINVVWFKRDLRLRDHLPLKLAIQTHLPIMLVYIEDTQVWQDCHYDQRHKNFVYESIEDINHQLRPFETTVHFFKGDTLNILKNIHSLNPIKTLFSYQEIGLNVSYSVDKKVQTWVENRKIKWQHIPYGAVFRGLKNRNKWARLWEKRIHSPTDDPDLSQAVWHNQQSHILSPALRDLAMQPGGERRAWQVLHSFLSERGQRYHTHLSSPSLARHSCSRLSPYLAWGNISLKQAYHRVNTNVEKGWSQAISALSSRLHWHCHFIQKFESECEMEHRPVNKAYYDYPYEQGPVSQLKFHAWATGKTGIPLVDACMKALHNTGYVNFRMRAMLVSVLCHHLNVHWKLAAEHLATLFLDFEPGIHYPQIQMQAGVTGTNTIRIYNPLKQSKERDPNGIFIKKWLPQLAHLPDDWVHEPWRYTSMDYAMENITPPDYPCPIVDLQASAAKARERLWAFRKRKAVYTESERILKRHTTADSPAHQLVAQMRK